MSITFRCEHCHMDIKAPPEAAGRRGKCPHCGQSTYIPAPVKEEDILPLAPLDEQEERNRQKQYQSLLEIERDLLAEMDNEPAEPLESKKSVSADELYHFVVNYCMDMANGKLERAAQHAQQMKKFGFTAHQAVEDFQTGKALEPALDVLPTKVLHGYLAELKKQLG